MATGYCTLDDVRRALRSANLPGDISQDEDIAIDAIASQTRTLEKELNRHYYESGGLSEDDKDLIPTDTNTRDDEHDLPSHGGEVIGAAEPNRVSTESRTVFSTGPSAQIKERPTRGFVWSVGM